MAGAFYRSPDADLSQGDIVDGIPHVRLRREIEILRQISLRGDRLMWSPFPYPPQEGNTPDAVKPGKTINLPPFHFQDGEYITAFAQFIRALVLN